MRQDFQNSFNALEKSTKFREYIPNELLSKFVIHKIMNIYNRIECLVMDSKYGSTIQQSSQQLEECKKILDNFEYKLIQEFLDRILYLYYAMLVSYILNKLNDYERILKLFKGEIIAWKKKQIKDELPIKNFKEFLELKVDLLEIRYLESGNQNRVNDIMAICKALRSVNMKINTEFSIKLSIKMADICFMLKDTSTALKFLISVIDLLKTLKTLPKVFKIKYRYLVYSKITTIFLDLHKFKDYTIYLAKFNKNSELIRKFNISIPGTRYNDIQIALMNNKAVYDIHTKSASYYEIEDRLKIIKDLLDQNGKIDKLFSFVIDNNLACMKFLMQSYIETLNILKKNYYSVSNWQSTDSFSTALCNLSVSLKTMQNKKWLEVLPGDEFDIVLNLFKDKVNDIYKKEGFKITNMYEVRHLIYIYNSISVALNQNKDQNIEILKKIIDLASFSSKIQEGSYKVNIWCGFPSIVLKLLYAQGLAWFYKKDYGQGLIVLNSLDELSKYIDLNSELNILDYVNIIKLRADVLYKLEKFKECIEDYLVVIGIYDKIKQIKSENRAAVLYNLGMAFLYLKNTEKSKKYLEEAKDMYSVVKASVDKLDRIRLIISLF